MENVDKPYDHESPKDSRLSYILGKRTIQIPINEENIKNIASEIGKIILHWPKIEEPEFETRSCFPEGYYKNNDKEKILLAYAENFRRQFTFKFPHRKPLLFQAENDCGLHKMVSTTIRPTFLPYPELQTWQGCACFVADYIKYEPLERQMVLPKRILSPFTVLKRHKGTSFEMATVLVSFLTGVDIEAYVVIGHAERNICLGIEDRNECPDLNQTSTKGQDDTKTNLVKYTPKPRPTFQSNHLLEREKMKKDKERAILREEALRKQKAIEELENPPPDDITEWRIHAWVLVLQHQDAFYIEPFNGQRYATNCKEYFQIQSVYNHKNYYVYLRPESEVKIFDFSNIDNWLPLLSNKQTVSNVKKELDMPHSWVEQLEVSNIDYEKRYPNGSKVVKYKKVIVEKFAPFLNKNGLIKRISKYNNYDYSDLLFEIEWYVKRNDYLVKTHLDYKLQEAREYFAKGQKNHLSKHVFNIKTNSNNSQKLEFYHELTSNNLVYLQMTGDLFIERYKNREDGLVLRKTILNKKIHEYFYTQSTPQPMENIAEKIFNLEDNTIIIKFAFDENFITGSFISWKHTDTFETDYNVKNISIYMANKDSALIRPTKLIRMLKSLKKKESESIEQIRQMLQTFENYLKIQADEKSNVKHLLTLFNIDKNEQIKNEYETLQGLEKLLKEQEIYGALNREELYLTKKLSVCLREDEKTACIEELKKRNTTKEDNLKQQYEKCLQELNEIKSNNDLELKINFLKKQIVRQEKKSKETFEELQQILDKLVEK